MLVIEQEGASNSLSVDQSNASNSSVGGLDLGSSRRSFDVQAGAGEAVIGAAPTRETTTARTDTLDVLGYGNTGTARQTGSGNTASITLSGSGGSARLLQDNLGGGLLDGNSARIIARDGASVAVGQVGLGNDADLDVSGNALGGAILQSGNDNTAGLSVTGAGSSGLVSQIGNNNTTGLSVTGVGTSVSYTLQGNGLSPATAGGVQVMTNNASVQIVQTALPGIGVGR